MQHRTHAVNTKQYDTTAEEGEEELFKRVNFINRIYRTCQTDVNILYLSVSLLYFTSLRNITAATKYQNKTLTLAPNRPNSHSTPRLSRNFNCNHDSN